MKHILDAHLATVRFAERGKRLELPQLRQAQTIRHPFRHATGHARRQPGLLKPRAKPRFGRQRGAGGKGEKGGSQYGAERKGSHRAFHGLFRLNKG